LPIEFTLLRYKPRPWTAADTFLISAYMWKTLTTTWKAKLNRGRITALVGPERAREFRDTNDSSIVAMLPVKCGSGEGVEKRVDPTPGACPVMGTANTMQGASFTKRRARLPRGMGGGGPPGRDPIASTSACKANYYYRSILIKGKAALVKDPEKKMNILERMMEKYQPERNDGEMPAEILEKTAVIEILIKEITGKENLG
jgi:hypothetical protein